MYLVDFNKTSMSQNYFPFIKLTKSAVPLIIGNFTVHRKRFELRLKYSQHFFRPSQFKSWKYHLPLVTSRYIENVFELHLNYGQHLFSCIKTGKLEKSVSVQN